MKIPNWLEEVLPSLKCVDSKCTEKIHKEHIYGFGVTEEKNGNLNFFFLNSCPKCKKDCMVKGFDYNFEKLAKDSNEVLNSLESSDELDSKFIKSKDADKKRKLITIKDIKNFSKELQSIKTHEDFLARLGIDIEKDYTDEDK